MFKSQLLQGHSRDDFAQVPDPLLLGDGRHPDFTSVRPLARLAPRVAELLGAARDLPARHAPVVAGVAVEKAAETVH